MSQQSIMKFDPADGEPKPYPSHAAQWREWHGEMTAWLFCPWTGQRRDAESVGSDPFGILIVPPGETTASVQVSAAGVKDAERYRYIRNRICFTGNGDGTCSMHAINLPTAEGWPEIDEQLQFIDAAFNAAMAKGVQS